MRYPLKKLSECCESGGLQTGPFGSQLKASEYVLSKNGIPVVMPQDLINGRIADNKIARISERKSCLLEKHRLKNGDIVFARRGEMGRSALVGTDQTNWICGTGCLRFRPNESVDPAFVFSAISHPASVRWLEENAVGQTMLNLNTQILGDLEIPSPSLPEQKKIAEILSTWDDALEKLDDLIDAKEQQKRGLMQQLLTGKKRLPGFRNVSAERKRIKFIFYPTDWKSVRLGEITTESSERNVDGETLPVLSSTKHDGLVYSEQYFGKKVFAKDTSNYRVVPKRSFAYATNHVEEGSIGYQDLCEKGLVSPIYTVFKAALAVEDRYLWRVLKSPLFLHHYQINTNASVNRRGSLRYKEFAKIPLAIPSIEEQTAIASVLDTADEEISLLKQKRDAIDEQKRGLMQQLLTGKIRVKLEEGAI